MSLRVATDGLEAAEAGGVGWWVGTAIGGQLAPPEYHGWWWVSGGSCGTGCAWVGSSHWEPSSRKVCTTCILAPLVELALVGLVALVTSG